jgi:hypothetical protein
MRRKRERLCVRRRLHLMGGQQMTTTSMPKFLRSLALAAAAVVTLSFAAGQRAEAMSLITPGASPVKAAGDGLIQVRGGHGGGGGHGGFHGGGFHGGGFHGGGMHAFRGGGGWHGGRGWHGGGMRYGGFRHYGGYRVAHFHHHRRFFHGGYYPPYYGYYPRCRIVYTYYGPRRVCGHRWHHYHRWHYHRHYW